MKRHPLCSVLFGILISIVALAPPAHSQLTKIENKLPKNVPLEVEFKNYDRPDWWHHLEITVTNTGKKPIFYTYLWLVTDRKGPNGNGIAFPFQFGDGRLLSTEGVASGETPAIYPDESYTFKIDRSDVKAWDLAKTFSDFVEPREAVLRHGWTSFGDGTGLKPGGTSYKKKL